MTTYPAPPHVRVVSVFHPFRPAFTGEGEWWLRMVPPLRERGIDVQILTSAEPNGHPAAARIDLVDGVVVHRVPPLSRLPTYPGRILALLAALRGHRRRFDVAVFHAPNYDAVYASCLVGHALGWKTVYKMTLQGSDDLTSIRDTGRFGRVRLASLALADGYISMTPVMVGPYRDHRRVRDRLLVVGQGVDVTRFAPPAPAARQRVRRGLGLAEHTPVALFCGGIVKRKGIDILIEAWPGVLQQLPNAVLLLAGPHHRDGLDEPFYREFSEWVHQRIPALGLQDHVRLLGLRRDLDQLYGAADIFVLPSRAEGWGAVISEAMACGLPCVISPMDGIGEEHLRHGHEGVILSSESPDDWAAEIAELLSAPDRLRQMGHQARCRVLARLSMDLVADRYAHFFRRIARGS